MSNKVFSFTQEEEGLKLTATLTQKLSIAEGGMIHVCSFE